MKEMIRKRIIFHGYVQGVGFRWRAKQIAESLRITGWVSNMADGSVQMEIQGTEAEIDRVVIGLQESRYIDIRDIEVKKLPVDEEERSFRIR